MVTVQQVVAAAPSRRTRAGWAVTIATLGAFLAFLDATIVNICFPAIASTFPHASTGTLAWILNAYNLVFGALLVAGGQLADVIGRRRTFLLGVTLFTAASALCATAGSVEILIAWRVLQAAGAALLVPASLGVVINAVPMEQRAGKVALWGAAAALAAGVGPLAGGSLVAVSGWRLAFLVNVPLGVAALIASRYIVESRAPGRRRTPDLVGTATLALALAVLSLAIIEEPEWHWTGAGTLACFAIGAGLLGLVARRLFTQRAPVLDPALLRVPTFAAANLATMVAGAGMYAYLLNHVLWLHYVWGYSLLRAGLAVAPSAFVTAIVAAKVGHLATRHGFRAIVVPGALLWAAALWWFAHRVGTTPAFLHDWLPGAILAGAGAGATLPQLGSAGAAAVPFGRYATASSVISAARQIGGVFGISLLVVLVGNEATRTPEQLIAGLRHGWEFSAVCFVVVAVIATALRRPGEVVESAGPLAPPALTHNPTVPLPRLAPAARTGVFSELDPTTLAELAARSHRRTLLAGRTLFREGEAGTSVHVVLTGRLLVHKNDAVVADLGPGSVVGELAALTHEPRNATITAARDSEVAEVASEDLHAVLKDRPDSSLAIARALAREVRALQAAAAPSAAPSIVAVIAAAGPAPVAVADSIGAALSSYLKVVTPGRVDAVGLERAERQGDRVLLVAGTDDEEWRAFCLRHADRVVVVGAALPQQPQRYDGSELVLLGNPWTDAITAWLEATGARRAHVVERTGYRPLAARLAGRSLGVALAGGGARAFAHIGLLQELDEAGLAVDRLSGTSVGAYVAAAYASGVQGHDLAELFRSEFVLRNPIGDWTVPQVSLSRGGRIRRAAERVFGDSIVEELPRELTVTATDIYRRESVVLRHGRVAEVTRASAALPVLLPPVRLGERTLVDGALTGNLPVAPLVEEGVGPVLASNLSLGGDAPTERPDRKPRVPAMTETLMRALLFAGAEEDTRAKQLADVVVTARVGHVGLLEFHQIDAAIEAGRAAGRMAVAELTGAGR